MYNLDPEFSEAERGTPVPGLPPWFFSAPTWSLDLKLRASCWAVTFAIVFALWGTFIVSGVQGSALKYVGIFAPLTLMIAAHLRDSREWLEARLDHRIDRWFLGAILLVVVAGVYLLGSALFAFLFLSGSDSMPQQ